MQKENRENNIAQVIICIVIFKYGENESLHITKVYTYRKQDMYSTYTENKPPSKNFMFSMS